MTHEPKGLKSLQDKKGLQSSQILSSIQTLVQPRYIAYLAGPITDCSFDECVDWREAVCELLPDEIEGMSPMRGKTYLEGEESIAGSYERITASEKAAASYERAVLSSARGIMTRDYNDCSRSDIVIANFLGAQKVSVGTVMEVAWAYGNKKPIIAIIEDEGNPHDHPMMTEAFGFRVNTLEQAVDIAIVTLLPRPHRK